MTAIDWAFPCMSPDSADPGTVTPRQQVEEIERELDQRRRFFPDRVARGQLRAEEAEHRIDVLALVLPERRWHEARARWSATGGKPDSPILTEMERFGKEYWARRETDAIRWVDVIAELQREILMRRRYYPLWIDKGSLDPAAARQRLERIEAVFHWWWTDWFVFMPPDLTHAAFHADIRAGRARRAAAWRDHLARFTPDGRRGEYADTAHPEQKELFG